MKKRHSAIPSQTERILAVLQHGKTLTAHDMHQMGIMQCNMPQREHWTTGTPP